MYKDKNEAKRKTNEWRKKNPEKVKAWHRKHYKNNKKKRLKASSDWRKRPEHYAWWKRYEKKHLSKIKARRILRYAIQTGKVRKPKVCDECFSEGRIHGHHKDYSKPLAVIWLCPTCHSFIHRS